MPTELTAESTHDDIQSYVDQMVADTEADRAGEVATDANAIATDSDDAQDDLPATGDLVDEDTAEDGEKAGESSQADWLDEDLKAEVAAYGLDETEVADFSSREELERALRLFDKNALETGRKAMAEGAPAETVRDEQGRFAKQETTASQPKDGMSAEGRYEVGLDKELYDGEVVDEFTRMRDYYESRLEVLESRFHEADARAEEQLFDSLVDSLGHADLFGKSGRENQKQFQRRQDLLVAVKAQQIGLTQLGRPTDLNGSLVNRVARMVFAEDLGKKELKSRTHKISKQANGRQGGGATRPSDPPETARDAADRLYREMVGS